MPGKIRFGMVGTGFIADWVLAGARQDARFEAVAICSRTQERADAFAAKHGIPHTFTLLEEMAASPLVDAVYIATPNFLHASQSILCMRHGKHVLCEKPLASNAREARQMVAVARECGVTLMEAMISTLNPNFRVVQEYLPRLGTIRRYFASFCQYSSRYDKFRQGIVLNAFNPELSNGAMMDIGVYTVYPMVALFGRPLEVEAQGIVLSSRRQFPLRGDECHGALFQDRQFVASGRDRGREGQPVAGRHPHHPRRGVSSAPGGRFGAGRRARPPQRRAPPGEGSLLL